MSWRREKYLTFAGNLTTNLLSVTPQHNRYTHKAYSIPAPLRMLEQAKKYIGPVFRTPVCEIFIYLFISNHKEYNLYANVIIIQSTLRYHVFH